MYYADKYCQFEKVYGESLDDKDIKLIKQIIRDVISDVYRDIWLKRNTWKNLK